MIKFNLLLACAALSGVVAQGAAFNAVTDFSLTGNPNGVWTYGQGSGATSFSALTTSESVGGLLYWENGLLSGAFPSYYPRFLRNTTGSDIVSGSYIIYADSLEMAATSASDVILRFIAPTAGTYTFSGDFRGSQGPFGASVGTTANVFVFAGTTSVLASAINGTNTVGISFSRTLAAGDVVRFGVSSPGDFIGDSVALRLQVNSVDSTIPEPSSVFLMATGAAALLGVRKRISRS